MQVYQLTTMAGSNHPGVKVSTVDDSTDIPTCLDSLGLSESRPTLVVVGGASGLDEPRQVHLASLFRQVLAPLAEELRLYVVDGGTDAGIMQLMGQARTAIHGRFALVGIAPRSLISLPGKASPHPDASTLEPNHTHCILVPGDQWGDESPWLASVATQLAGPYPSLTILINGGSVTWQDAYASINAGRSVIVMAGSGRTADVMVQSLSERAIADPRMEPLLSSGLVSSVDLDDSPLALKKTLQSLLLNQST